MKLTLTPTQIQLIISAGVTKRIKPLPQPKPVKSDNEQLTLF